ncbi:MAG: hypothetical protein WDM94_13265 [Bauldia sp.]
MKTSHGLLALSAAALFTIAAAATSFAEDVTPAATDNSESTSANTDLTGRAVLGIDISNAGNTPETVQNFFAGLSSDDQTGLRATCSRVLSDGSAVGNLGVIQFCQNLQAG